LETDASGHAIGGVLSQEQKGKWRPIAFLSRTMQLVKRNYKIYNKELLVRHSSHRDGSPQNRLGDERTCGMTLASAYMLRRLSAAWSQLQMKKRKSEWK